MCKVKIRLTQPNWVGAGAELGNKLQCSIENCAIYLRLFWAGWMVGESRNKANSAKLEPKMG